jgi:hypothetical protein
VLHTLYISYAQTMKTSTSAMGREPELLRVFTGSLEPLAVCDMCSLGIPTIPKCRPPMLLLTVLVSLTTSQLWLPLVRVESKAKVSE